MSFPSHPRPPLDAEAQKRRKTTRVMGGLDASGVSPSPRTAAEVVALPKFSAMCPAYGQLPWYWQIRRTDPHRSLCEAAYFAVLRNSAGIAMGLRQGHCGLASMAPVARSTLCIAQASLTRAVRTMS